MSTHASCIRLYVCMYALFMFTPFLSVQVCVCVSECLSFVHVSM